MSVALPALIVFLLLLPGFIFRTRLKRAERASLDFSPFGQVAAEALLWALVVHLIWLALADLVFRHRFEPVVLMKLLSTAPASQIEARDALAKEFNWISAYFISLLFAAFAIPTLIRFLISKWRCPFGR